MYILYFKKFLLYFKKYLENIFTGGTFLLVLDTLLRLYSPRMRDKNRPVYHYCFRQWCIFYARARSGFSPSTYAHRDALAIRVSGAVTWIVRASLCA